MFSLWATSFVVNKYCACPRIPGIAGVASLASYFFRVRELIGELIGRPRQATPDYWQNGQSIMRAGRNVNRKFGNWKLENGMENGTENGMEIGMAPISHRRGDFWRKP